MVCCSNIQILWFWLSTKHEYHEFGFEVNKVFSLGQAIDYRSSIQSGSLKSTSAQPQWFFRVAPFTLLDIYRTNTLSPLRLELDKIVLYPRGVSFCYGHKSIETAIQLCWNQQDVQDSGSIQQRTHQKKSWNILELQNLHGLAFPIWWPPKNRRTWKNNEINTDRTYRS